MNSKAAKLGCVALVAALTAACNSTQSGDEGVQAERLTVGVVQKEIVKGMPSTDVVVALGSPNIVKTNQQGNEVWVYDKFSREQVYQTASGALGYFSGNGGGVISGSAGSSQVSSNTLTVIIKFDKQDNVDTIAYHRSKF